MTASVNTMSPLVQNFFSTQAEKIARETIFVQRTSKMTGHRFLKTVVFGCLENATASLNDLTGCCEAHCVPSIRIQALAEPIHQATLTLVKQRFRVALGGGRQTGRLPGSTLSQFSAVNLTAIPGTSRPASVAEDVPGSGGAASAAGRKLQWVMDFLTGSFKAITLTDGITPDQKAPQHLALADPGSLHLLDLGSFVLSHLNLWLIRGPIFWVACCSVRICIGKMASTLRCSPCCGVKLDHVSNWPFGSEQP